MDGVTNRTNCASSSSFLTREEKEGKNMGVVLRNELRYSLLSNFLCVWKTVKVLVDLFL